MNSSALDKESVIAAAAVGVSPERKSVCVILYVCAVMHRDVSEAILDVAAMLQAPRASLNVLCASRCANF